MRTSILSTLLLGIIVASTTLFAFADDAFLDSTAQQFEPKSYTTAPLYSTTPRGNKTRRKATSYTPKTVPLEVKRTQAKMQRHDVMPLRIIMQHHDVIPPPPLHRLLHRRPAKHKAKPNPLFASLQRHHSLSHCIVYPGSLQSNIRRIAGKYGWHRVVWALPEDYRWVGKTRISAQGLFGILEKLLKDYPLQAKFYEGNHVLVIIPRTIQ